MYLNQTRNITMNTSLKKQQGSMLVIALFVIIVLGFLAYAMIQITDNSNRATVFEVYGARALNAANSGSERALNEVLNPNLNSTESCDLITPNYELGDAALTTTGSAFSGCSIAVECAPLVISQTGFTHFRIESKAKCIAGEFITNRTVAVEARIITP